MAVAVVDTRLTLRDHLAHWKVRWGIGRMRFTVEPGLYALGGPDENAPVLVSCNYRMSFDLLRQSLSGRSAWILVLDTKGVNVWCAAGKGSFGTKELVQRLASSRLKDVVRHRKLILPQLGAVGVNAAHVKAFTGFQVVWGPVRAADLGAFLDAGQRADPAMRRVQFKLADRLALVPIEFVHALWLVPLMALLAGLASLPLDQGFLGRFGLWAPVMAGAPLLGSLAFPILLPRLPFRAFALKGLFLGVVGSALLALPGLLQARPLLETGLGLAGSLGLGLPVVVWLAMNFTGSTTFTCQTGATRELEASIIPLVVSLGLGLLAAIAGVVLRLLA